LYNDPDRMLELKAALWAVGHVCYSERGVRYLIEEWYEVIPSVVLLATACPEITVRGTCFYVLGLVGATPPGVGFLAKFGQFYSQLMAPNRIDQTKSSIKC
jgi:hypothetical protein